jgi:hypothetical protein
MATAKTEILTVLQIDAITGQQIVRELNADELAQLELDKVEAATIAAEAQAKATARASALAKLAELGLTADEIAAL